MTGKPAIDVLFQRFDEGVGGGFVARGSIRTVTLARITMKIALATLAINYVNYVLRLLSDSQPPLRGEDDGASPLGNSAQSLAVRVTST